MCTCLELLHKALGKSCARFFAESCDPKFPLMRLAGNLWLHGYRLAVTGVLVTRLLYRVECNSSPSTTEAVARGVCSKLPAR